MKNGKLHDQIQNSLPINNLGKAFDNKERVITVGVSRTKCSIWNFYGLQKLCLVILNNESFFVDKFSDAYLYQIRVNWFLTYLKRKFAS